MNLTKRKELASVMTGVAKEYRESGIARWKGDVQMIRVMREDANELRHVGTLLRTKGAKEAWRHANSMDTCIREVVPNVVWDALAASS